MFISDMHEIGLFGRSDAVRAIEADIECAARSDAGVLITGEAGVDKEAVARLIHKRSARTGPLVAVNCAGLPDPLLESELFGHVRGSFAGAYRDKTGLLEMAPDGMAFLDEAGEMSARVQVALLRFLETSEIHPIGARRPTARVDIRPIAATSTDLQGQVDHGAFREDLYYRLNVVRLNLPPLRERVEDLPVLIGHYLDLYSLQHRVVRPALCPSAMEALMGYPWPGNVRELRDTVERLALKFGGETIRRADLPFATLRESVAHHPPAAVRGLSQTRPSSRTH